MTNVADAYQVTKEQMDQQRPKIDGRLSAIHYQSQRKDIREFVKAIDDKDTFLPTEIERGALNAVRDGLALYLELSRQLSAPLGISELDTKVLDADTKRKRDAVTSYALFAASSYISQHLAKDVLHEHTEAEFTPIVRRPNAYNFEQGKNTTLDIIATNLYATIVNGKTADKINDDVTFAYTTKDFFEYVRDEAKKKAQELQTEDFNFDNMSFVVEEDFTFTGYHDLTAAPHVEVKAFEKMMPQEVMGNSFAKQQLLRYVDRLFLYDFDNHNNPINELGGLSWSVLMDGFPGTGKTSLIKVMKTMMSVREEQLQELWKQYGPLWQEIVIDDKYKDKYYGESGKLMRADLEKGRNPSIITLYSWEDIDLFMEDRDSDSGGSGKDLLNIAMQHLDGGGTVINGNAINVGTTNEPTGLDNALRQRFHARFDASGPETWYDFADLMHVKLKKLVKNGLIAGITEGKTKQGNKGEVYVPFSIQEEMMKEASERQLTSDTHQVLEKVGISDIEKVTWADIGRLCRGFKDIYPRFTGRPVHSVSQAVMARAADFDIPQEWWTDHGLFLTRSPEEKKGLLKELYQPVTGRMIVEELDRYYDSETRYQSDKFESDVAKAIEHMKVSVESDRRFKEMVARGEIPGLTLKKD